MAWGSLEACRTHLQLEKRATVTVAFVDNIQYPERVVCGTRHQDAGVARVHGHLRVDDDECVYKKPSVLQTTI